MSENNQNQDTMQKVAETSVEFRQAVDLGNLAPISAPAQAVDLGKSANVLTTSTPAPNPFVQQSPQPVQASDALTSTSEEK